MKIGTRIALWFNTWLNQFSIRVQLMLMLGVLMCVLTLGSVAIFDSETSSSSRHQADNIGHLLSAQTASAAVDMLVIGDRLSLNVLLSQLVENPYVADASIFSIDNRRIARASSDGFSTDSDQVYSAPIHYQDVIAGYVKLSLNEKLLTQKPRESLWVIIAIGLLLTILGLLFLHLFCSALSARLRLIERQLFTIFPNSKACSSSVNEITRITSLVENQLTETWQEAEKQEEKQKTRTSAILAVRAKNLSRLQQLLAPKDLQQILKTYSALVELAARCYSGEVTYTPEGNAYIRFSSEENEMFSTNALSCGLMIDALLDTAGKHSIATIHIGAGLSFSEEQPEFPDDHHPALMDSAASQALHLANISEPDGLHLFRTSSAGYQRTFRTCRCLSLTRICSGYRLTEDLNETLQSHLYEASYTLEQGEKL